MKHYVWTMYMVLVLTLIAVSLWSALETRAYRIEQDVSWCGQSGRLDCREIGRRWVCCSEGVLISAQTPEGHNCLED